MRFEDSKFFKLIPSKKIEFPFGNFYISDQILISELNEGIHFDWDKILQVIDVVYDYFGGYKKIGDTKNIEEWFNSEYMDNVRKAMLEGKYLKECEHCYKHEAVGIKKLTK